MNLNNRKYSGIDSAFFAFIFLMPLIPRPTIENPLKYLGPLTIMVLIGTFITWRLMNVKNIFILPKKVLLLITLVVFILLLYLGKIVTFNDWRELPYFISKLISFILLYSFLRWMILKDIPIKSIYKCLFSGVLILSFITIFCGITGISLFGEEGDIRPPRVYGITLPFYKTSGIPRSFGEFGIFMSVAWSYVLMYRYELKNYQKIIYPTVILLAVIISQSRSTYIAILLITLSYFLLRHRIKLYKYILIAALALPIIIGLAMPILIKSPAAKVFIGESTYEKNVLHRLLSYKVALDLIVDNPKKALAGITHANWKDFFFEMTDEEVVLHNNFLSSIIFLGIIAGLVNIFLLLLPTLLLLTMQIEKSKIISLIFLITLGSIVCLQFYEGFFSIIFTFQLSILWYFYRSTSINKDIT